MKKLFTLFAALLCAASMVQVQAKEFDASYSVLTVYEGSETNVYVPYYGFYADAFLRSQYVVPASELTAMKDHSIIGLGYYLNEPASHDWNSTVQVRLKEVNYTSISDFEDMDGVEAVGVDFVDVFQRQVGHGLTSSSHLGHGQNGYNLL